jgi:hypothetical protein
MFGMNPGGYEFDVGQIEGFFVESVDLLLMAAQCPQQGCVQVVGWFNRNPATQISIDNLQPFEPFQVHLPPPESFPGYTHVQVIIPETQGYVLNPICLNMIPVIFGR